MMLEQSDIHMPHTHMHTHTHTQSLDTDLTIFPQFNLKMCHRTTG